VDVLSVAVNKTNNGFILRGYPSICIEFQAIEAGHRRVYFEIIGIVLILRERYEYMRQISLSLSEIFMIQAVLYLILWLWNDFAATIFSLSFAAIAFFIFIIALIAEAIEPSKVPRKYFYVMLISAITPLIVGSFFMYLKKGTLDWMIFSF
jgi:hypothetical protein